MTAEHTSVAEVLGAVARCIHFSVCLACSIAFYPQALRNTLSGITVITDNVQMEMDVGLWSKLLNVRMA